MLLISGINYCAIFFQQLVILVIVPMKKHSLLVYDIDVSSSCIVNSCSLYDVDISSHPMLSRLLGQQALMSSMSIVISMIVTGPPLSIIRI